MLHSTMTSSIFSNSFAEGNEGAPAKFGNADYGRMTNDLLIANAGALLAFDANKPPDYNQYLAMPYRADDGLPVAERVWSNYVISNNTLDVGQNTIVDDFCYDSIGVVLSLL